MARSREQTLIDTMFEVLMRGRSGDFMGSREQSAAWLRAQLRDLGFDTEPCGLSWAILRGPPPNDAPAWATPEAEALLKSVEEFGPIYDVVGFSIGRPWNAYLASLKPKTVTLPERYVVDDGHRTWAFATRSAADKLAQTQGGYVRVLPAETREVP